MNGFEWRVESHGGVTGEAENNQWLSQIIQCMQRVGHKAASR